MQEKRTKDGVGDEGFNTKVFPKELMRRRWSMKEIITIIFDELARDGKLRHRVKTLKKEG